jgi:glycosyltransferase involved in cell wall biosynthesis
MRIAVLADAFPVLSETFVINEVRALRRLGHDVVVVAGRRGEGPVEDEAFFLDQVDRPTRATALAALAARRPRRVAADLADRRSWRPAERPRHLRTLAAAARRLAQWRAEHVHVHFAAGAAVDGLRLGALLDVPVSITAHAYEIFMTPLNLERKLHAAAFTTTGCAYNVRHLESVAPGAAIHEIVMGVDGKEFRRATPYGSSRHVVAIGRLVEKKGFGHLIDAAATLRERVTIVGEGPLRAELEQRIAGHGLGDLVQLAGARSPEQIRELLEDAAVLAMPCVVAADGDRDSMPVVVKEALAMEVPVVCSDEVGLPEIVDAGCGRLVAPADAAALAAALRELLDLPVGERAALGRAGRARVLERCDVDTETAKLVDLMRAAA